ncbi:glycosyltransferase family 2 protein [Hypoxylon rubiginosum]|uniref:Glycosyltransferase family 2 protein n=1 Tax=Hypoxylon rubiginosum TaxID=110542 RepID=A0ACC0CKC6_9PEZI|nr:glycosyltransferase family 2 protein [Hypoxylon rubiginosum]
MDNYQARAYAQQYRPFPVPPIEQAKFAPSDVSIIVPTVDWDNDLSINLRTWLRCRPREIIFVTTTQLQPKLIQLFQATLGLAEELKQLGIPFHILTVEHANKRAQLCRGINEAKGKIVALVDDDARWTGDEVLTTLLAPFENDDVGLVGGPIESYIPYERQRSEIITGWEVAALRTRSKRRGGNRAFFAADGSTNFTVSGLTMLLRTEIVKDPYFQHLFTNDLWRGAPQNTGDDGFITRYVLFHHHLPQSPFSTARPGTQWRLGMQFDPRATVQTSLLTTSQYVEQSRRWYRSGLRLRLTCLLWEPGMAKFWRTAPYMARKMAGSMFGIIFNFLQIYLWFQVWSEYPKVAGLLFLWRMWVYISSLSAFCKEFPYIGISNIWAAVLADHTYLISDLFSWSSLWLETWSNRPTVGNGEGGRGAQGPKQPKGLKQPKDPKQPKDIKRRKDPLRLPLTKIFMIHLLRISMPPYLTVQNPKPLNP